MFELKIPHLRSLFVLKLFTGRPKVRSRQVRKNFYNRNVSDFGSSGLSDYKLLFTLFACFSAAADRNDATLFAMTLPGLQCCLYCLEAYGN